MPSWSAATKSINICPYKSCSNQLLVIFTLSWLWLQLRSTLWRKARTSSSFSCTWKAVHSRHSARQKQSKTVCKGMFHVPAILALVSCTESVMRSWSTVKRRLPPSLEFSIRVNQNKSQEHVTKKNSQNIITNTNLKVRKPLNPFLISHDLINNITEIIQWPHRLQLLQFSFCCGLHFLKSGFDGSLKTEHHTRSQAVKGPRRVPSIRLLFHSEIIYSTALMIPSYFHWLMYIEADLWRPDKLITWCICARTNTLLYDTLECLLRLDQLSLFCLKCFNSLLLILQQTFQCCLGWARHPQLLRPLRERADFGPFNQVNCAPPAARMFVMPPKPHRSKICRNANGKHFCIKLHWGWSKQKQKNYFMLPASKT